jgi:hypothetical protein
MREPLKEKWNRVQKNIQQAILTSYPNPNRDGCPGTTGLFDLAKRAAELGTLEGDKGWDHVTHCSPCYKEFLEARDRIRKSKDGGKRGGEARK